jgi:hypothetical protein
MKKIGESKRFIVGWGRDKGGRICFFVSHKDINPQNDPVPINPEDLSSYMMDAVKYLRNPKRNRERFVRRWEKVAKYI